MSNQVILWGMLIFPLLTIFFMKLENIKRFMPVALFTVVTQAIIIESGITLGFWGIRETLFPLNQMPIFTYGAIPAFTMWIFKFTYERFGLYIATNAIIDFGYAYVIIPWLVARGIGDLFRSSLLVFSISIIHAAVLYGYQIWQEGIFALHEKASSSTSLQPAAAKPLSKSQNQEEKSSDDEMV